MTIPLNDASRRPARFPVVTASLIAVNVFVFIIELVGGDDFVNKWALIPARVTAGTAFITILTSMFMHASWSHILGNMVFLWAFGPEIEEAMGIGRYTIFYLLGGAVAMMTQVLAEPHSTVPNLGASGAIAAVMGGFLVTYPRDRIRTLLFFGWFAKIALIPAALLIAIWFLLQLVSVGTIADAQGGGVAYLAHIGGTIFGAATARLFEGRKPIAPPDEIV